MDPDGVMKVVQLLNDYSALDAADSANQLIARF